MPDEEGARSDFVCPRCHGELANEREAYRCDACSTRFPIILGIPDFRVEPDPWIGIEEDRAKARRLIERTEGLDFAASVAAYWEMTPGTSADQARRFTEYVLGGERRASDWLDALESPSTPASGSWLEIGCASGDLVAAAASRGIRVVGVDVAMRWLVLARKRTPTPAGEPSLVCANGEFLPFRRGTFARVVSVGTLEHCRVASRVLTESARVLRSSGEISLRTANRFTLLPEPHVDIWGVGFVPRRWADAYVRWRGGTGYEHHHCLSVGELARSMRDAGFSAVEVVAAQLLMADHSRLGRAGRAASPLYQWARSAPLVSVGMSWISPLLEARGRVA